MSTRFETIDDFVKFLGTVPEDLFIRDEDNDEWDDEDDDYYDDGISLSYYPKTYNDNTIEAVENGCCDMFILPNGAVNHVNIAIIQRYGYDVYHEYDVHPGEDDPFGWLTGILEFPDGRQVCFG